VPKRLQIRRVTLADAQAFVAQHHAHHAPDQGHRFSLGCYDSGRLCGVAVVGRPRARRLPQETWVEVTRHCTDRTPHAASMLYAAAARAAFALGFERIFSDVLDSESGGSLLAAGWRLLADEHGIPVKCGHPQGSLGWDSRQRTEPLADALGLRAKHVGGYKHRWYRDNPELVREVA
jgi:hypothetical protein